MPRPTRTSGGRAAAVLGSLLLTLGGMAPVVLAAETGATIVVAADGSGAHDSIGAALRAAAEGDTILVRPGTYEEAIAIDRDVKVSGDGPRHQIVLAPNGAEAPVVSMLEAEAELSGLTVRAPASFVHVIGGEPVLRDLHFDSVGSAMELDGCHALFGPDSCNAIAVRIDGGSARLEGNTFEGAGAVVARADAAPTIVGNTFRGGGHVFLETAGDGTLVAGNTISGPEPAGIALYGAGRPLILGNVISGAGTSGIDVGLHRQPGIEPVIEENTIIDSPTGIQLHQDAVATLASNVLTGNTTAIVITGSDAHLTGNRIIDNATGVFILQGAPELRDNVISGGTVGLGLGSDRATPVLTGNSICGNETDINLVFGAEMPDVTGDEPCPGA